jgi:hypothetical protein
MLYDDDVDGITNRKSHKYVVICSGISSAVAARYTVRCFGIKGTLSSRHCCLGHILATTTQQAGARSF